MHVCSLRGMSIVQRCKTEGAASRDLRSNVSAAISSREPSMTRDALTYGFQLIPCGAPPHLCLPPSTSSLHIVQRRGCESWLVGWIQAPSMPTGAHSQPPGGWLGKRNLWAGDDGNIRRLPMLLLQQRVHPVQQDPAMFSPTPPASDSDIVGGGRLRKVRRGWWDWLSSSGTTRSRIGFTPVDISYSASTSPMFASDMASPHDVRRPDTEPHKASASRRERWPRAFFALLKRLGTWLARPQMANWPRTARVQSTSPRKDS
jgi:hypothetical protein